MQELNKILDKRYQLIRQNQSKETILKSEFKSIGRVLKIYSGKIDREYEKALREGEEKVIIDICDLINSYDMGSSLRWKHKKGNNENIKKTVPEEGHVIERTTASDANRKIISISEGCRTGKKGKIPGNLKFIHGKGSPYRGHPGKSSFHPHLKLVRINNPPATTYDPNEAA